MIPPLKNMVKTAIPISALRPRRCGFEIAYAKVVVSTIAMVVPTTVYSTVLR